MLSFVAGDGCYCRCYLPKRKIIRWSTHDNDISIEHLYTTDTTSKRPHYATLHKSISFSFKHDGKAKQKRIFFMLKACCVCKVCVFVRCFRNRPHIIPIHFIAKIRFYLSLEVTQKKMLFSFCRLCCSVFHAGAHFPFCRVLCIYARCARKKFSSSFMISTAICYLSFHFISIPFARSFFFILVRRWEGKKAWAQILHTQSIFLPL